MKIGTSDNIEISLRFQASFQLPKFNVQLCSVKSWLYNSKYITELKI